jgi:hypothetical protein
LSNPLVKFLRFFTTRKNRINVAGKMVTDTVGDCGPDRAKEIIRVVWVALVLTVAFFMGAIYANTNSMEPLAYVVGFATLLFLLVLVLCFQRLRSEFWNIKKFWRGLAFLLVQWVLVTFLAALINGLFFLGFQLSSLEILLSVNSFLVAYLIVAFVLDCFWSSRSRLAPAVPGVAPRGLLNSHGTIKNAFNDTVRITFLVFLLDLPVVLSGAIVQVLGNFELPLYIQIGGHGLVALFWTFFLIHFRRRGTQLDQYKEIIPLIMISLAYALTFAVILTGLAYGALYGLGRLAQPNP